MPMPAPSAKVKPGLPGRPKDLNKGAAILVAARRLFVEQGYEGVSMDQIAAEAGVSKLTVYSHFGDKEKLFVAAAKSYCDQRLPTALFDPTLDTPLRERLLQIGSAFLSMVMSPEAISGHRMLCTSQMAASGVPKLFWESGPQRVQQAFGELLARRVETGELRIENIASASSQFFVLLKGDLHAQRIFGFECNKRALDEHLANAVDMFLSAYAVR